MAVDGLIAIDGDVPKATQEKLQGTSGIGGRGRLTSDFPSMVTADSKRESAGLLMSSGQNLRINIVKDLNNFRNSGEKSANRGRNRHRDRDDD
jgi:hypothetical protein